MQTNKSFSDRFDWSLTFILFLFFIVSLVAISSAQTSGQYLTNFVPRQALFYIVSAGMIAVLMYFDTDQYKKMAYYLYGAGILLLLALMIAPDGQGQIAQPINGAKAWFHTPFVNIQPAEFMKTFYILALAKMISSHHEHHLLSTIKTDLLLLGKIAFMLAVPLGFILLQPDLGTALVFIAITLAIVVVSGISWKIILPSFGGVALIGVTLLWMTLNMQELLGRIGLKPYMFERIYTWLDPYSYAESGGYNLIAALNAIGSGEVFGKGYQGRQVYVPENHTDFIFTVISEDFGFIGASAVIILFFMLIYHLTKITLQFKDTFSTYVCAGIIAMITFHVFQNIGMTIQLLPITGIPLPFISYGGSSLIGNMLALGVVFSMRFHHKNYMFDRSNQNS
ncbi:rod shape-determining protein RodA [Planococcus sp. CP5-4]|uniref:FtsW/RodA/SpoVE family cell cycle protein n=1 Tax=unclassified Planococcus (in: firmicutes) TaxID=2662419 RepID=UPI001C2417E0|nr:MULTISPECIES: FtsW/RodA/SpoVE family cell cycle protein [unclassified Planococcus (in: firmicutes)]MBU9672288.1 rod shape-determining protein RodA [Planococcus sp. CP5-4_YE]MBV0909339.1 rod shape-determining protein RodA [Planococcus sp. CP5-4_UN]MBW6064068.1 rod shape-determining protein RodA [Planococcus sp. CP5-4]